MRRPIILLLLGIPIPIIMMIAVFTHELSH
jgi:hypothetical protein